MERSFAEGKCLAVVPSPRNWAAVCVMQLTEVMIPSIYRFHHVKPLPRELSRYANHAEVPGKRLLGTKR